MTVVATLLLLFPLHLTFKNRRATRNVQLLVVSFLGLSLGCAIYLTLFAPFPAGRFSPLLAASYALFGLGASTLSWALYTWGPLRIELTHSEA